MGATVITWATRKASMEDVSVLRANLYSRLLNRAVCHVHIENCKGLKDQWLVPEERFGYLCGWDIMQSFDHRDRFGQHYEPVTPEVIQYIQGELAKAEADEANYAEQMKTSVGTIAYNTALASRDHARKMQTIHKRHLAVMV